MEPHCWELEAGDWFCGATKKVRRGKVRNKRAPDIMALMLSLSQAYGNWVLSSDCSGKVWFSWARWAGWAGILPFFLFMNVFFELFSWLHFVTNLLSGGCALLHVGHQGLCDVEGEPLQLQILIVPDRSGLVVLLDVLLLVLAYLPDPLLHNLGNRGQLLLQWLRQR